MADPRYEIYVDHLAETLDPKARREFGLVERRILIASLEKVGMLIYPTVSGSPEGERASGDMLCYFCGQEYFAHPMDWRVIGFGDVPFLNVLCDGRRVKL